MPPEASNVSALGFSFTLAMCLLVFFLDRRRAAIPILIISCYVTLAQMVIVGGLHFSMLRVLILVAWIRVIVRGEVSGLKLETMDKVIIIWALVNMTTFIVLRGTWETLVNRLGFGYNVIGLYFFFRCVIRDFDDIEIALKSLAIAVLPLAVLMLIENATGRNLFAVFGGVNEITVVREGRLRCEGPFRHPILAGTFGATTMPLFLGLWFRDRRYRVLACLGVAASTIIMGTSASSGPLIAYIFSIIAMVCWYFRNYMRFIKWGILLLVVALHVAMKAPVWALIGRLSEVTGGTGWHRVELIDAAYAHFHEWWLLGTAYTANWFSGEFTMPNDPNNIDITNQYIAQGIDGGLLSMLLFISIIVLGFRGVGRAVRGLNEDLMGLKVMVWCMGAALLGHAMGYLSVTYFDQNIVFWYLLLALISVASSKSPHQAVEEARATS